MKCRFLEAEFVCGGQPCPTMIANVSLRCKPTYANRAPPSHSGWFCGAEALRQIKKPRLSPGLFLNRATSYSPTHLARAVPSGLKGLTSVFGMGTGGTPSLQSPKDCMDFARTMACKLRVALCEPKSSKRVMRFDLNIDGLPTKPDLLSVHSKILWSSRTGY